MAKYNAVSTKRFQSNNLKHSYRVRSVTSQLRAVTSVDQLASLVSSSSRERFDKACASAMAGNTVANCEIAVILRGSEQRIAIDLVPNRFDLSNLRPHKIAVNVRAVIE